MFITIGIPTYEMKPHGADFLDFSLNKIARQTTNDFNVLISDHSTDDSVKNVALRWAGKLNLTYLRNKNEKGNPSSNINNILNNATGEYIKLLFQDDFLIDDRAIENTINVVKRHPEANWFVTESEHTVNGIDMVRHFVPFYNDLIFAGVNTISSPSVVTVKNTTDKVLFDSGYKWLLDCIYYKQNFDKFGFPIIINHVTVVNRMWGNQLSNQLSNSDKDEEILRARKLYSLIPIYWYYKLKKLIKTISKC